MLITHIHTHTHTDKNTKRTLETLSPLPTSIQVGQLVSSHRTQTMSQGRVGWCRYRDSLDRQSPKILAELLEERMLGSVSAAPSGACRNGREGLHCVCVCVYALCEGGMLYVRASAYALHLGMRQKHLWR